MDIKSKINEQLILVYGPFETYLDNVYFEVLTEKLLLGDYTSRHEWLTYNQVVLELKYNVKDPITAKKIQYNLTDNQPPKFILINLLKKLKHRSAELNRLYFKILNF